MRASCWPRRAGISLPRPESSWAWAKNKSPPPWGVSVARVSQIEHGEVTSFVVIARYAEALGGRLDLAADFGDRTVRLPVTDTTQARTAALRAHGVRRSGATGAQARWR